MTSKEFFEKLMEDAEIGGKLAAAKTPEEAYEIAKANGLTDTMENFMAAGKELNEMAAKLDLSEVSAVVGGGSTITTTTTTTSLTVGASAAVAANAI